MSEDPAPAPPARTVFDPFIFIPVFAGRLRTVGSGWFALPPLAAGLLVVIATLGEGTFGTSGDFQFVNDVRYVFSDSDAPTRPDFPLIRDVSSMFFLALIIVGSALLHRQWQLISVAIAELRASGTIVARQQPIDNLVSRAMGLHRLLGPCADYQALDRLDERMGQVKHRTRAILTSGVVIAGFVLATLLGNGLNQNIFRVFVPATWSAAGQEQWLGEARDSWWAGPQHPAGLLLFSLIAWYAMTLILTFNVVGLITVYVALALYFVAEPGADWYNRDGRYGWMPVARIYRTVYLCLVLLGGGIAWLIALLGSEVLISVAGLAGLYLLLLPVYTVVPWMLLRTVEGNAKARRRAELTAAMQGIDERDLAAVQLYVAEFARVTAARIQPMRMGTVSLGAFASVVLLPIVLTIVQVLAPAGLGG